MPTSDDPVTRYAKRVVAGKVVAGPHVRAACRRHLRDLVEGPARGLVWSAEARDRALGFFPDVLRLNAGQFEGRRFELHESQAFIVGSIFGWLREDGTRRFRTAYVEEGKGNGKSPLAGGIGLYGLTSDGEARAEVYSAATSKDQAMILFRDAVAMVDQSPALKARLIKTPAGDNCEHLGYPKRGSWFTALASAKGKGQSGPRPHFYLVDELHEHSDAKVVNMAAAGQKFRRQPLVFEITNSGFDRTTVCFDHHQYSIAVLAAEAVDEKDFNDAWFAYICALDEGDDPFEDESCWIKANPLLGVTIQLDYLRKQVTEARGMPAQASTVRRLNFCEWVDAENPWISGDRWRACEVEPKDFDVELGAPIGALGALQRCPRVVGAIDLSGVRDLTALALAGEDSGGNTIAKVEQWSPGDTIDEREKRDRVPYRAWRDGEHMHAPPGEAIDYGFVAQRMVELQTMLPHWKEVAFDPYRIPYLRAALDSIGAEFTLIAHPQGGYKSAAKKDDDGDDLPVLWMPRSIELLTIDVLKGQLRVEKNPVLTWNSASAVLEKDSKANESFSKRKSTGRIDGLVALTMADGLLRQDAVEEQDIDDFLNSPIIG